MQRPPPPIPRGQGPMRGQSHTLYYSGLFKPNCDLFAVALSPRCFRPFPPGYRGGPRGGGPPWAPGPGGPRMYRPPHLSGERSPMGSPPYSPRMGPRRGGPPPGYRPPRGRGRFPVPPRGAFLPGPAQPGSAPPSPLLHSVSYQNMIPVRQSAGTPPGTSMPASAQPRPVFVPSPFFNRQSRFLKTRNFAFTFLRWNQRGATTPLWMEHGRSDSFI